MTLITTVILVCDACEALSLDGGEAGPLLSLQAWLREHCDGQALTLLGAEGPSAPSANIWASDFSRMGVDAIALADYAMSLVWNFPESVVLMIQPEEGDTRTFRPSFTPSDIWRT